MQYFHLNYRIFLSDILFNMNKFYVPCSNIITIANKGWSIILQISRVVVYFPYCQWTINYVHINIGVLIEIDRTLDVLELYYNYINASFLLLIKNYWLYAALKTSIFSYNFHNDAVVFEYANNIIELKWKSAQCLQFNRINFLIRNRKDFCRWK